MVNSFNNAVDKQEYIFKLLPDFGVFDIAERHFIENGKTGIDKLFFYDFGESPSISNIKFRRFIMRSNGNITLEKNTDEEIITHDFTVDMDNYKVVIDEQFLSNGFTVSSDGDYLIGVCF